LKLVTRFAWALAFVSISCAVGTALARAATPATKQAVKGCWSGYSYAGVQSPASSFGVSATISLLGAPTVPNGHVAAWVGVGGAGLGPGGSDEWVQAGIAHDAGQGDVLYYEVKRPADATAQLVSLGSVSVGESHKVAVVERAAQRDAWRVLLDGQRVSPILVLPGSHGSFAPVATAESWDGGTSVCNRYAFDFTDLAVATQPGGSWAPFQLSRILRDPAYQLALRNTGFTARG
jgi:hypothetical protein